MTPQLLDRLRDREGATLIFVALSMVALLSVAGLAIDVGYAFVVKAELQSAADAAALAGARLLYLSDGTAVNGAANAAAADWATRNQAEQLTVTVENVERGHWRFSDRTFTPNETSGAPPDMARTTEQLDDDTDFVNAVRVVTRRTADGSGNLRQPFFAGIFGAGALMVRATAIAYIGYAGTLAPGEVYQPFAVCRQALMEGDRYSCSTGRVLTTLGNSAAWTNFTQPCMGPASDGSVRSRICGPGNDRTLMLGQNLETTTLVQSFTAGILRTCWLGQPLDTNGDGFPDRPWRVTVPVIDCPGPVGACSQMVGAVDVDVLWVTSNTFSLTQYPTTMYDPRSGSQWTCSTSGAACWPEFVSAFNLQAPSGGSAVWQRRSVYFLPSCQPHQPVGLTGGQNFGVLARVPVLVH
jgi:Flp pilus assembly protein TadG